MSRFVELDPGDYALPEPFMCRVLSPALVVYLDHVRENLRRMIDYLGGDVDRWRPHVKTLKIPAVYAELLRAGVRRFKCATTREADHLARVLADEGVGDGDILVAYPLVGPALRRLGAIAEAHGETRFAVLCEDPEAVVSIPRGVDLFVDVNPGMNRTGLELDEQQTILEVARRAGDRFRGVHYYDGQFQGDGTFERRQAIFRCYDALVGLVHFLNRRGVSVGEIVTSGTPAFLHALLYPGFADVTPSVHRVSPGTVVYHDLRSERENPDLDLVPAAVVFTRIVSRPRADLATCDAGSKSIAAEAGDPCAFVLGHPELEPLTPSEEHLPLRAATGSSPPPRGTELLLVPRHVCPTINLAEQAILVEAAEVRDVASVSARAHDLLVE